MSTPLDAYMTREGIKDADFAARIKRDRTIVSKLRRGLIRPTLDMAATIESETGGAIPMKAWIDAPEQMVRPASEQEAA